MFTENDIKIIKDLHSKSSDYLMATTDNVNEPCVDKNDKEFYNEVHKTLPELLNFIDALHEEYKILQVKLSQINKIIKD